MLIQTITNVFKVDELRNKIMFTLGMLIVYRIGFWIPLPGVNQSELSDYFQQVAAEGGAASRIASYVAIFSGGSFGQSTIFGLGIMPYISAAIVFQLLGGVVPVLKQLKEEGPTGQQKIQEWTRYVTIALCIVQGAGWLVFMRQAGMVYPAWATNPLWWLMAISALTAGTVFLMWLGEQIDRFGIGNGVSLILTAGIIAGMPNAVLWVAQNFEGSQASTEAGVSAIGPVGVLFLMITGRVMARRDVDPAGLRTIGRRRPIRAAGRPRRGQDAICRRPMEHHFVLRNERLRASNGFPAGAIEKIQPT